MALNWKIDKCRDHEELTTDEEWPVTQALIFGTMSTGLWEITEANWREFYRRTVLTERVLGATLSRPRYPFADAKDVKVDDVVKRDGEFFKVTMTRPSGGDVTLGLKEYDGAGEQEVTVGRLTKIRRFDGFEKSPITAEQVHRRIGLATNASPKTKAQFAKWLVECVEREMPDRVIDGKVTAPTR